MKTIDLNCDMGESFGAYNLGNDEQILKYIPQRTWHAVSMRVIRQLWTGL